MGFFRVRNKDEAQRELDYCHAQIKAMQARYYEHVEADWIWLQLICTKYREKIALCEVNKEDADRRIKRLISSYEQDAKRLAKLYDRLNTAKAWFDTHKIKPQGEDW